MLRLVALLALFATACSRGLPASALDTARAALHVLPDSPRVAAVLDALGAVEAANAAKDADKLRAAAPCAVRALDEATPDFKNAPDVASALSDLRRLLAAYGGACAK